MTLSRILRIVSIMTLTLAALAALAMMLARPAVAASLTVTVTELISNPKAYDGQTIVLEGECIGSIMRRGPFSWLSVNDGSSSVGVAAPGEMATSIKSLGNWKQSGDRVRVTGVVLVASDAHGGETLVEAAQLDVISRGAPREHPVAPARVTLAIVSVLLASVTGLLTVRRYGRL